MPKKPTPKRAQKNRAAEGEPSTLHGLLRQPVEGKPSTLAGFGGRLIPGRLLLSRAGYA